MMKTLQKIRDYLLLGLMNLKTAQFISDNGRVAIVMAVASNIGMMEVYMKVTGEIVSSFYYIYILGLLLNLFVLSQYFSITF